MVDLNNKKYKIFEATTDIDQEWIEFLQQIPGCSIYYHPEWLNILSEETNQNIIKLVCRNNAGKLEGILPLQFTKGVPFGFGGIPGVKRLSSLPRTPMGGPVATSGDVAKLLVKKAIEINEKNSKYLFQIKSFDENLNERSPMLSKYFWREFYFTDIPRYPEEIRFGNSKNHTKIKWGVNKAINSGIRIKYADSKKDLLEWYNLYLETMQFHTTPPRSLRFFKSLWNNLKSKDLMQLVLAELNDGGKQRIVAGSIFLTFNKVVVYAFNGSNRKNFELRPNDLIHWTFIRDAQEKGFEIYNWGEVTKGQEGLAAYKEKWSSRRVSMYHYYYPGFNFKDNDEIDSGLKEGVIKNLWKSLPLKVTTLIGSHIFKYL
jgi:hypothetical protein